MLKLLLNKEKRTPHFKNFCFLILLMTFIGGCFYYYKSSKKLPSSEALKKVGWWGRPNFHDDLDNGSLVAAIDKNIEYLEKLPSNRTISCGDRQYKVEEVKESFRHFLSIIKKSKDEKDLIYRIKKDFDIYRSVGRGRKKMVLFTGYYEPIIKGSRKKTEFYQYPIYGKPDDLIVINLGNFRQSLKGKRIVGRIDNGKVVPYYDRKSIDQFRSLSGRGFEIAWLSNPIDAFFLHIQGSGIIEMIDGPSINVNYKSANGRSYKSIGRLLIKEGKVPKEVMSMQAIRQYLKSHPEEMDRVLSHNESYVFFRTVDQGPIGSIGVQLTPGRSIASDASIFPKGGLAFIETEVPVTDEKGKVTGWKKISRFVVDQDTGGAIKGPGRIDIYFGSGNEAGNLAGAMNREGKLYYLIKKRG